MTDLKSSPPVVAHPVVIRPRSGRATTVAVVFVAFLGFFFMATKGTWNPAYDRPDLGFGSDFFYAQALAMVHGHLYVAPAKLPSECFFHAGHCFGYFGLTPSLLRIPFLPILDLVGNGLTPVFLSVALTIAVASMLAVLRLLIAGRLQRPAAPIVFTGLLLGPCGILMQIARPAVYEEAIAWAAAFFSLALYGFLRWWVAPSWRWLLAFSLAIVLGANSRPTVLFAAPVLAIAVAVRLLQLRASRPRLLGDLVVGGCAAAVAPVVTCLGVYWLKLGQFIPSLLANQQIGGPTAEPWWVAIRKVDHDKLQGIKFLATNVVADLRLNAIFSTAAYPYVSFSNTVVPISYVGLPPGAMFVSPVSSITDDMPLAFLIAAAAVVVLGIWSIRHRPALRFERTSGVALAFAVLAAATSLYPSLTTAAFTNRYLGDFFPLVGLLAVWGVAVVAPSIEVWPRIARIGLGCVLAAALAAELWINFALAYVSWWK